MKLIDIDKLVSDYKGKNKSLKNVTWFELTDYEVKAIPIEWIKGYYMFRLMPRPVQWFEAIQIMLEDWEKENGRNQT